MATHSVAWSVAIAAGSVLVFAASGPAAALSSSAIASCIRDARCHRTFVVAHRAKGFGAPENSRAAVARAVAAGVPVINVDVRTSADGEIFALHDDTLDRAARRPERIDAVDSRRFGDARLANGEPLPRFTDLYSIARGRAMLSVTFKVDVIGRMADWIHAHGSFEDLIFFANTGEEMQSAAQAKRRYPDMIVMVRLLDTRVTVDGTRVLFGGRLPEILHTDPLDGRQVSRLRALGTKVFVSAVRTEGNIQPLRYLLLGSILRAQPDFVETDHPKAVMRRLTG